MIVVVQVNQLAELQMAGQRCGFRGDALHQVAVAHDPIGMMIDDLKAWAVVARGQVRLCYRHTHAVTEPLA